MTTNAKKVLDKALGLSPMERAELVEQVLSSFDFPERKKIDALWATEAEDRIDAFERGDLKTKSAKSVFKGIEK